MKNDAYELDKQHLLHLKKDYLVNIIETLRKDVEKLKEQIASED